MAKQQADRPPIPAAIAREVRQRCAFGCVVCGHPLYDYHHMLGWANVKEHVAKDITLLCSEHHTEHKKGLLPDEEIARYDTDPCNRVVGRSRYLQLHYSSRDCIIHLGQTRFGFPPGQDLVVPLVVDELGLIAMRIEDGHLLLSLNVFDEYNSPILTIQDNALAYAPSSWDVQFVGNTLTIRDEPRVIAFQVTFEPPASVTINRGTFLCNGVGLAIDGSNIVPFNCDLKSNVFLTIGEVVAPYGIVIGDRLRIQACGIFLGKVRRYSHSFSDLNTAMRKAVAESNAAREEAERRRQEMDEEFRRMMNSITIPETKPTAE
jgi:trigger factor